jgi:hypothetical protein
MSEVTSLTFDRGESDRRDDLRWMTLAGNLPSKVRSTALVKQKDAILQISERKHRESASNELRGKWQTRVSEKEGVGRELIEL